MLKIKRYIKAKGANAAIDDNVLAPPAGKTYAVKAISFTGPGNGKAACYVLWNSNIVEAAQSDKFVDPEGLILEGDGIKQLVCRLDNSNNPDGALLGIIIYYEELG
jgi:hypothetical protein